jgi:hypothetical protein
MAKLGIVDYSQFKTLHCFDPGGTTGYAKLTIEHAQALVRIDALHEFHAWSKLDEILNEDFDRKNSLVIYENFTTRTLAAHLIPVEVIGVLKYLCGKHQIFNIEQSPQCQGPTWVNNVKGAPAVVRKYPELNIFTSHFSSALRHGIYFVGDKMFKTKKLSFDYDFHKLMSEVKWD